MIDYSGIKIKKCLQLPMELAVSVGSRTYIAEPPREGRNGREEKGSREFTHSAWDRRTRPVY